MSYPKRLRITKASAARRQLQTAIALWFAESDPVSIHTLACAAHEIIHDLHRKKGLSDLIYDSSLIKDEYRKRAVPRLKAIANVFKHGEKDGVKAIDLDPAISNVFIFMSLVALQRIGESLNDTENAFIFWNKLNNNTWFEETIGNDPVPIEMREKLRSVNKSEFLKAFLDAKRGAAGRDTIG